MKRQLLFVLVIALVAAGFCFNAARPQQRDVPTLIEDCMESVVMVKSEQYPEFPASGFYIGKGIVVTAGHVAVAEHITEVEFEDGTICPVLERYSHPDYDCGFLIIEPVDKPALPFDLQPVRRGEDILILGHPKGMTFISTKGIVTGFDDCEGFFGDVVVVVVDAVGHRGNSGSVVIDLDGEVRGVHVGGRRAVCGSSLHGYESSISVADILNALEVAGLER